MTHWYLCSAELSISNFDLSILCPFMFKIRNNLATSTFNEMSHIFPRIDVKDLNKTWSHVQTLSCFKPMEFACCINLCICYTGLYANLNKCPNCNTLHLASGLARWTFSYMPLIPWLHAFMLNCLYATYLQYHAEKHLRTHISGKTTDIFDGLHYLELLREHIVVKDWRLPHTYFSDHHDIALGFATDGFAPFKNWKQTAWILLIFNYNLPPDKCF
jgi:hypothetical protein